MKMVTNMKVNGNLTKSMARVHIFTLQGHNILGRGYRVNKTEKVYLNILAMCIKETSKMD